MRSSRHPAVGLSCAGWGAGFWVIWAGLGVRIAWAACGLTSIDKQPSIFLLSLSNICDYPSNIVVVLGGVCIAISPDFGDYLIFIHLYSPK